MSYRAGSAFVDVKPDMSTFQDDIKAELARTPDLAIKVTADTTDAKAQLGELGAASKATVTADADTKPAEAQLDALTKKKRTATIDISEKLQKGGTLTSLLNPVGLGATAAVALGPQALGLGAGLLGIGAGFGAAAADAGAFGVIAKGMFTDVEAAQKKLTAAQAAYNKATTDKGRAAALKAEQQALAGLTPAEKDLATQLTALEGAWKRLSQAEQPAVGAALAPWLQTATSGMKLLKPLIEDGANAVGLLGKAADTAIKSPFWQLFSTTLGTTGDLALQSFGTAAGSVADGLAHLFTTFAPDIDNLLTKIPQVAGDFDKWAKSVTSGGLENFFSKTFSPANVATLKQDGQDLAKLFQNVAAATSQLSPAAFGGLNNVLDILAKLSPGQIEALTGMFLAAKALGGAGNLAKLATGGASLSLPFVSGGKGAKETESTAGKGSKAGKIGSAAVGAVGVLGLASAVDQAIPKGPGGEWVNSWAPYEKIFTDDLPKAWSISYEAFQVEFAGPMTAWFSNSLPHFFTSTVPGAWSWAYQGFETEIGSPVAAWFSQSLPHFFTSGVPGAWSWAYQGFEANVGSPVAAWFTGSVPHFFTSAVPSAWSWAYTGFERAVGSPVAAWFSSSVPHFFTAAVPSAWSWAWTGFESAVGSPVSKWFGSSLPSFVTRSIPGAFSSLWSSFSSSVVGPVENFFTSTLPGLASNAKGLLHNLGIPGFASGTPYAPPGWAWVGEQGPELMRFGGGEQVLPHVQSMASAQSMGALSQLGIAAPARLPGVGSPLSGGQIQLVVTPGVSDAPVMNAIVNGMQFHIQGTTGGDVQAALGLGPVRTS